MQKIKLSGNRGLGNQPQIIRKKDEGEGEDKQKKKKELNASLITQMHFGFGNL